VTASQKAVTPLKNGVQESFTASEKLDSGFRRNDEKTFSGLLTSPSKNNL